MGLPPKEVSVEQVNEHLRILLQRKHGPRTPEEGPGEDR